MRSGILLIDKPAGISSAHAIKKIEKRFRLEKIGHGGTLDPFATGLLVVLVGEATKIARFLLADRKGYSAVARIGWETETGDREGERAPGENDFANPPRAAWEATLPRFLGKTLQTPPKYSAVKVAGKKLYEYARARESVAVAAREIMVYELELRDWRADSVAFRLESSGGTYVRTLAADWARATGTRAHLTELRRYRVGNFRLEAARPLSALLETSPESELPLISIPDALAHLPRAFCSATVAARIRQGDQSALPALVTEAQAGQAEHILLLLGKPDESTALALLARTESGFKLDRVFAPS